MSRELLFDTNALIDIYKGRQRIRPYFEAILNHELTPYLSVISEAELWRGLRVNEVDSHHALLSQYVSLPLHSNAARQAGLWMQQYQPQGLGWMDALIVGTAVTTNVPILTRDKNLAEVLQAHAQFELYGDV